MDSTDEPRMNPSDDEESKAAKRARLAPPIPSEATSDNTAQAMECVPCKDQEEHPMTGASILDALAMEEVINTDADDKKGFACDQTVEAGISSAHSPPPEWEEVTVDGKRKRKCKWVKSDGTECGKCVGDTKYQFNNHWRTHTRECLWTCDFSGCTEKFTRKDHLQQHQQTHSNEKPYACGFPGCDLKFKRVGHLKEHKLTHSNEYPFECLHPGCKRKFRQKGTLTQHVAFRHSNEYPIKCDQLGCEQAFKKASDLVVHKADVHDIDVVWHKCDADPDNCDHQCKRMSSLYEHIRTQHPEAHSQRKKRQEERVRQALLAAGWKEWHLAEAMPPVGHFRREKRINFECAKLQGASKYARIDFVLNVPDGFVFLEVDEHQHNYGYGAELSCDMKRMANVMESLAVETDYNAPPIYWLRYNTHAWHVGGKTRRTEKSDREANLVAWLKNFKCVAPLGIGYAFYDCEAPDERGEPGALEVLGNEEYNPQYAEVAENLMDLSRVYGG